MQKEVENNYNYSVKIIIRANVWAFEASFTKIKYFLTLKIYFIFNQGQLLKEG